MSSELDLLPQFDNPRFADAVLCVEEEEEDEDQDRVNKSPKTSTSLNCKEEEESNVSSQGENVISEENEEVPAKRRKCESPCQSKKEDDATNKDNATILPQQPSASSGERKSNDPITVSAASNSDNKPAEERDPVTPATRYHVHRFLLASHSKYFDSLFAESEKTDNKIKEIKIKVKKYETDLFERLLQAIYSNSSLKDMYFEEIVDMIPLADRLQCDIIINQCLVILTEMDIDTIEEINSAAECFHKILKGRFSVNRCKLQAKLYNKIKSLFAPDLNTSISKDGGFHNFTSLSEITLERVLASQLLSKNSENSLMTCILGWIATNKPVPTTIEKLIGFVCKENLTSDYLHDVLTANQPLLTDFPSYGKWFQDALQYHSFSEARKEKTYAGYAKKRKKEAAASKEHTYLFDVELGPESVDAIGSSPKIYNMVGPGLLCEGYVFEVKFIVRDDDISLKLSIPNLLGIDGKKVYLDLGIRIFLKEKGGCNWKLKAWFSHIYKTGLGDFEKRVGDIWSEPFSFEELSVKAVFQFN